MLQLHAGLQCRTSRGTVQILAFEFMRPHCTGALGQAIHLLSQSSCVPLFPVTSLSVLSASYQIKAGNLSLSNHFAWLWSEMLTVK